MCYSSPYKIVANSDIIHENNIKSFGNTLFFGTTNKKKEMLQLFIFGNTYEILAGPGVKTSEEYNSFEALLERIKKNFTTFNVYNSITLCVDENTDE